jgi:hypothetical protein
MLCYTRKITGMEAGVTYIHVYKYRVFGLSSERKGVPGDGAAGTSREVLQ